MQKCFKSLFFPSFFFFLLIISDRIGRKCVCRQITQNNINHPKSLMINYIIIYINFLDLLCWFKHAFIWKLQRIEFSGKVCKFLFWKLCKIVQVTLYRRLLIKQSIESFLKGFLLIKTWFYVKIAENIVFSLLIVFSQGMFCKLAFCKLQNMRWPSNVTWNI